MKGNQNSSTPLSPFQLAVQRAQKDTIEYALETANNDWATACNRLGLSQQHFRYYCDKLNIKTPSVRTVTAPSISDELPSDAVVDFESNQESQSERDDDDDEHVTYNSEGEREIPMELLTGGPSREDRSNVLSITSKAITRTITSPTLIVTTTVASPKRGRGRPRKVVDLPGSPESDSDSDGDNDNDEGDQNESASDEV